MRRNQRRRALQSARIRDVLRAANKLLFQYARPRPLTVESPAEDLNAEREWWEESERLYWRAQAMLRRVGVINVEERGYWHGDGHIQIFGPSSADSELQVCRHVVVIA
jgi:hypothetical protein